MTLITSHGHSIYMLIPQYIFVCVRNIWHLAAGIVCDVNEMCAHFIICESMCAREIIFLCSVVFGLVFHCSSGWSHLQCARACVCVY